MKGLARFFSWFKKSLGITIALAMILISLVKVLAIGQRHIAAGENTLIISHWQLEDGYREGLQQVIDNFVAYKKQQGQKVSVFQSVVPWRGYRQWAVTQLVGGNPVDIMQLPGVAPSYIGRFFLPLSGYASWVNPHNVGSPLAGLPWKETFIDGMASAWNPTLMGYYSVGTAAFTWRIFYNKDLLERITGCSEPPPYFEDWLRQCRQIADYARKKEEIIVPLVVRGFDLSTVRHLYEKFSRSLLFNWMDKIDIDLDGDAHPLETYYAKVSGLFSWHDEEIKAPIMMLRDLARYFQSGFSAVDLEQAKFLFLNNKAVFLPEGSWQSKSLYANAPFQLGVFKVPPPGHNSAFYRFFDGNITEVDQRTGVRYGITRASRNPELAMDFLMFMTSYEQNILWNESAAWLPVVRFAELSPFLEKFRPDVTGIPPNARFFHPFFHRTRREFFPLLTTFLIEQQDPETRYCYREFINDLEDLYRRVAQGDALESLTRRLRGFRFAEHKLSQLEVIEEFFPDDPDKTVGLDRKKEMLMESMVREEELYNLHRKLVREAFKD